MLVDEQSAWAMEATRMPTTRLRPLDVAVSWHRALGDRAIAADVVPSHLSFEGRSLIILPTQYMVDDDLAARLRTFVEDGGHLLVGFASGIVNGTNRVIDGGYPGALREILGIHVDEIRPLMDDEQVTLDDGSSATIWTELVVPRGADVVRRYADGVLAGEPAVTRHRFGRGTATYVSCRADDALLAQVLEDVLGVAGVQQIVPREGEVAVTRRVADDGRSYLFLINSSHRDARVTAEGTDLLTGTHHSGSVTVAAGGVVVLEESSV